MNIALCRLTIVKFTVIRMKKEKKNNRKCEEPVLNHITAVQYCYSVRIEYLLTIISSNI